MSIRTARRRRRCCCGGSCNIWFDPFDADQAAEYVDHAPNGFDVTDSALIVGWESPEPFAAGKRFRNFVTPPEPTEGLWYYVESDVGFLVGDEHPGYDGPFLGTVGGGLAIAEPSDPQDVELPSHTVPANHVLAVRQFWHSASGPHAWYTLPSVYGDGFSRTYCNCLGRTRLEVWKNADGTCDVLFFVGFSCVHRECSLPAALFSSVAACLSGWIASAWSDLCIGSKIPSEPRYCEFTPTMFRAELPSSAFSASGPCTKGHFKFDPLDSFDIYLKNNGYSGGTPDDDTCAYSNCEINGVTWPFSFGSFVNRQLSMTVETVNGGASFNLELILTAHAELPQDNKIGVYRATVASMTQGVGIPLAFVPEASDPDNCILAIDSITVYPMECFPEPPGPPCGNYVQPEVSDILELMASLGGGTVRVCMGGTFDPVSRLWSWSGIGTPELGSCAGKDILFEIFATIDEQETCRWVIRITDTTTSDAEELPIEIDRGTPPLLSASGLLPNICGGAAFAADAQEFTGLANDDHPYMRCCTPTIAEQCDLPDTLRAQGQITYDPPCTPGGACSTSIEQLVLTTGDLFCSTAGQNLSDILTGFDPAKQYFLGPLPLNLLAPDTSTRRLLIWCDGSAMRAVVLDGNNCPDPEGQFGPGAVFSFSWDCETKTGEVDLRWSYDPLSACNCENFPAVQLFKVLLG